MNKKDNPYEGSKLQKQLKGFKKVLNKKLDSMHNEMMVDDLWEQIERLPKDNYDYWNGTPKFWNTSSFDIHNNSYGVELAGITKNKDGSLNFDFAEVSFVPKIKEDEKEKLKGIIEEYGSFSNYLKSLGDFKEVDIEEKQEPKFKVGQNVYLGYSSKIYTIQEITRNNKYTLIWDDGIGYESERISNVDEERIKLVERKKLIAPDFIKCNNSGIYLFNNDKSIIIFDSNYDGYFLNGTEEEFMKTITNLRPCGFKKCTFSELKEGDIFFDDNILIESERKNIENYGLKRNTYNYFSYVDESFMNYNCDLNIIVYKIVPLDSEEYNVYEGD